MPEAYMPQAKRHDHCTPQIVVDLLWELFDGQPHLDPCGHVDSIVGAQRQYLIEDGQDGLVYQWYGNCYVNPPFKRLKEFAKKAAEEWATAERMRGAVRNRQILTQTVFLMPSRTDTKAWHDYVSTAAAVCFWKGRLKFIGEKDYCPFPVAFPYWGHDIARFKRVFGKRGMVLSVAGSPFE